MFLPGPGPLILQPRENVEASVPVVVTIRLLAATGVGT